MPFTMRRWHQFSVIAKVNGRYRCLAAVSHLSPHSPALRACLCLLQIFAEPLNRRLIQHELVKAKSLKEEEWTRAANLYHRRPAIYFPFITTCLVLGVHLNPADPERCLIDVVLSELAFDKEVRAGENTIIDLTEASGPYYCFVTSGSSRAFDGIPMTPLSPINYLSSSQTRVEQPTQKQAKDLVEGFKSYRLIPTETLPSIWPWWDEEYFPEYSQWQSSEVEPLKADLDRGDEARVNDRPSLRTLSLQKTIDEYLETPEFTADCSIAKLLPDFIPAVECRLWGNPGIIDQAHCGMHVLAAVLESKTEVDLSPFKTLDDQAIFRLIVDSQLMQTMTSLDLSGNPHITVDLLSKLGTSCKVLEKIVLINVPQLPLESAYSALRARPDVTILHSESFLEAFRQPDPAKVRNFLPYSERGPFLPLIQILWICVDYPFVSASSTRGIQWSSLDQFQSSSSWLFSFSYSEIPHGLKGAVVSLSELRLYPKHVSRILSNFLSFILGTSPSSRNRRSYSSFDSSVAAAFAMRGEAQYQVHPIPARLYNSSPEGFNHSVTIQPELIPINEGEWTVIVTGMGEEEAFSALSYAFVTRETGSQKLLAFDFPTFMKAAGIQENEAAVNAWELELNFLKSRIAERGMQFDIEVCSEEEVKDVLRSVEAAEE